MSSHPAMELCSACNRFVQDNYRECKHHGTLRELKNCAETKTTPSCALCCLLWTGVQAQYSVSVSMSNVGSILASDYTLDLGYTRQGHLRWMNAKGTVMSDGTRPILGTLDIISEQESSFSQSTIWTGQWDAWTPQTILTVKGWLTECHDKHPWCGRPRPQKAPTRLVDIGDASSYRLIETKGGQKELYVALSYVWGVKKKKGESIHQLKLVKKTRSDLMKGIKPSQMTASHREGSMVARDLGYRYIWIDALCIMQDDIADWKNAAVEVPDIYNNAVLTITAGRSHDSRDGFLTERRPVKLPHRTEGSSQSLTSTFEVSLARNRAIGPADERAWCFQEALLSRRSLIFGMGQLIFKCRKHKAFQDGSHDKFMFDEAAFHHDWVLPFPPEAPRTENDKSPPTQSHIVHGWYRVAQKYAMRDMYDPFDCYAALAGIARRCESALAKASKDGAAPRYLCGLWETDTFAHALMWRRCLDARLARDCRILEEPGPEQDPISRAPSWSWMALVGRITFHGAPVTTSGPPAAGFIRVPCCAPANGRGSWTRENWGIRTQLEAREIQTSLPVKIEVKGRPRRVRATTGRVCGYMMFLRYGEMLGNHSTIDPAEWENLREHGVVLQDLRDQDEEKGIALALFDRKQVDYMELWALPFFTCSMGTRNVPSEGLLLCKNISGTFSRVGVFWVKKCEAFIDLQEQVLCIE
ncbi:HET domain protein [Metarhizium guizhouense ARSEF 977]|uniref:HET domain protein n=1 Tax=Metarhizium guizhouense (strain ARSEF 977) TaxID=1276136 RepID=A0A0B4GA78_METGA|nr:HET domain protein [Metarhizium guizhouense ARSEF 977]